MSELKRETIAKIYDLLKQDVEDRKDRMIRMIESGFDNGLSERIAEYRVAYKALDNFEDWADENDAWSRVGEGEKG